MKKAISLLAILALSTATIAEAKRGGGMRLGSSSRAVATKPAPKQKTQTNTNQQQKQADADFNNTPPRSNLGQNPQATAQPATSGSGLNNFVTGAMAGYILSDALSSNTAQAQEGQSAAQAAAATTEQTAATTTPVVEPAPALPTIPTFKAIEPQTDPFLIEKTQGYLRYCLNGVQYLISITSNQLPPTLMVDKNNAPVQCQIVSE